VFVHGAFDDRLHAHLVLRDAAARLAAQGFPVLRFDLYGQGESAGEFEDATLARWVADACAACAELQARAQVTHVALVGVRLGALVAARATRLLDRGGDDDGTGRPAPAISHLVLWQPVVAGQAYAQEVLRAHLTSEMVLGRAGSTREALTAALARGEPVTVWGYRFGPALYRELVTADLAEDLRARPHAVAGLIVDVVRTQSARGAPELSPLSTAPDVRVAIERAIEPQPLHVEGKTFVARADSVFAATVRFLEDPHAAAAEAS